MPLILVIILSVLYIGVGMLLAAPYIFLSGWNKSAFFYASGFLPVVAILLFLLYIVTRKGFWVTITYVCLPIMLNGISTIFKWLDYTKTAEIIFKWRFKCLVYIVLVALAVLVIKNIRALPKGPPENSTDETVPQIE